MSTVSVTALGMACPLGLSALAACAAIRGNLNHREELPYSLADDDPVIGAALPLIPPHTPRRARWIALAAAALRDTLKDQLAALPGLPLLIARPDPRCTSQELCALLSAELGVPLSPARVGIVIGGSSVGLRLVARARELLAEGGAQACVVLAADSLIEASTLHTLHRARRLASNQNPDGLHPGEAAACLLIQPHTRRAWGHVLGVGASQEPARLDNDAPLRAEGLAQASLAALREAGLAAHQLDFRVSDGTGESFYFKEQSLLPARILRQRVEQLELWTPALQLCHVGAAAGLCDAVIALVAFAKRYAPGPRALVCAGADDGDRAALVLEAAS
ncbi:hypothetical protein G6O69_23500 [Pseudenhygromyxa sp. WMMC2535]|uniref:hypothetical protein n=1 Tax=Pseudenhygromyxa sp. WMMC2535 TaxID=2712867 RepID=UPI001553CD22|nr:hypothetical protein [Pseudenhygromyxa sp. WMMC2535]NVB40825.1 hypothetical protein [Pseudenhygromyxa sp. WMMC2535]